MNVAKSLQERFDAMASPEPNSGCWLWTGAVMGVGYGKIKIGPKFVPATHLSLELDGRPRPDLSKWALHTCDNPTCVNPAHLWWGTRADNISDQIQKGRHWATAAATCKHGHPWTVDNTYTSRGRRSCKTCHKIRHSADSRAAA